MRPQNRTRSRILGAVTAVAVAAVAVTSAPIAARAQPPGGVPSADESRISDVVEHDSVESALVEVGSTPEAFLRESALADRLADASDEYTARFPTAFAGVRIDGDTGRVAVVRGAPAAQALTADARSRGFEVLEAPVAARQLDEKAGRVQDWADSLPAEQKESVTTIDVDPLSGGVTVLVDDATAAPVPPSGLGVGVQRSRLRPAQGSSGSSTQTPPDAPPAGDPLNPGEMVGGTRILVTSPNRDVANYCSLGFNGLRDGRVVNITAAHCSSFAGPGTSEPAFRPGTVSEGQSSPRLGAFTADEADEDLDAALISVDPAAAARFRNSRVLTAEARSLALSGTQAPIVGQTLCKYGQRTGYTCGKVASVDSASPGAARTVSVDLCGIAGDSGGVVFSSTRAVGVTSLSNAFDQYGAPYADCATARRDLARWNVVPQIVAVTVGAITARFPGLTVGAA